MPADWCIHYTGTCGRPGEPKLDEGRACRAGVAYRDVLVFPEPDQRRLILAKMPCIGEPGSKIHGGECVKREYPSPETLTREELSLDRVCAGLCPCCGEKAEQVGTSTAYVCPKTKTFAFRACGKEDIGP